MRKNNLWILGLALMWSIVAAAEPLPALGIGTIGVDTGLTAAIWGEQPDVERIEEQMRACADVAFNDSEREILERVLMTDVGGVAAFEADGERFLNARLDVLMRQGLFDAVIVLTDKIPVLQQSASVRRARAEALFASGRETQACEESYLTAFGMEEAFVRVACAAAVSEPPMAALAYDVWQENEDETHPFLKAAGDALYRALDPELPVGQPTLWEMPIVAMAFGDEVFRLSLGRAHLLALAASERVPQDVRTQARQLLKEPDQAPANKSVLEALIQAAEARRVLERVLPVAPENP